MKGIGLVFAGGGGKGAYEIGVWKYLHEIGLEQHVKVVSGTSVGALNAALFVGSDYETAEDLWLNISQNKILTPKEISAEEIMKWLITHGCNMVFPVTMGVSKLASGTIMLFEKIAQQVFNGVKGEYIFSRAGIKDMIAEGLDFDKLQSSDIACYATCVRCRELAIERFKLNEFTDEEITTLLLASSAIPVVFPNENFHGEFYCDGGIPIVGDNIPIQPVYDSGIETIFVVHLGRETLIDKEKFPNAKIIEIIPSENLGNMLEGTLDFSSEGAAHRLQLGYQDAKRILQPMRDIAIISIRNQIVLEEAQQDNKIFEKQKQRLDKEYRETKQKMANDGLDKVGAE